MNKIKNRFMINKIYFFFFVKKYVTKQVTNIGNPVVKKIIIKVTIVASTTCNNSFIAYNLLLMFYS